MTFHWPRNRSVLKLAPGFFFGGAMRIGLRLLTLWLIAALSPLTEPSAAAQTHGRLKGQVRLKTSGEPLHDASVLIVELGRSTLSSDDGSYQFNRVPPGRYQIVAHLDSLFTEETKIVTVEAGRAATADFSLELAPRRYEITVTGSEKQKTTLESFQSVESIGPYELAESTDVSLGEALDHQVGAGVAKRSFGPGASRPIVRGFDGDRVLVMEDGIRTGTLSSQSGDHGELINPAQLERLEFIKGPATLLYSGNAMGGTVNAISRHHEAHRHAHQGLRGFVSGSGGTNNALGGGSAGLEYGIGKWMFWGRGGGIRSGDYTAPRQGKIYNSRSKLTNGGGGFGWYGKKTFFSLESKFDEGSYGVPFAEEFHGHHGEAHGEEDDQDEEEIDRIAVDSRRRNYRFHWGLKNLGTAIDGFVLKLSLTDWAHDEIEFFRDGNQHVGTEFRQQEFVYRGVFEQGRAGPLSGRFGFWGLDRDYAATGEEALSPPIDQTGFAVFALEEMDFESVKFQFGGRLERQRYRPGFAGRGRGHAEEGHDHGDHDHGSEEADEIAEAVKRSFTGASASAGLHVDTWRGGALAVNYARSFRAPALQELYNFGPHVGTLTFEVGDPALLAETGDGLELSLRQDSQDLRGRLNLFYYNFDNFIFPFATGEVEGGLRVIDFTQRNARFVGTEANLDVNLNSRLWLNLGMDFVDAQDMDLKTRLPRIPPLRAKVGFDFNRLGFRIKPELILAGRRDRTFTGETPTPGYGVVNLKASYTYAQQHLAHHIAVKVFNLSDRLYRNHSSFIKDLAPEIGRGLRLTYTVRFF